MTTPEGKLVERRFCASSKAALKVEMAIELFQSENPDMVLEKLFFPI